MPRSNKPKRRRGGDGDVPPLDLSRIQGGLKRTEHKRSGSWWVQPSGAASAQKSYSCPGCTAPISPGMAHVVVWRADHMMGDDAALVDRRHWHTRCWRIEP
ncbi:hypothetical protein EV141_1303 [Microcella putealis]|uniref:ATP/GTP-binding protein n=1 Tax=Microcella putealis TaxID=337005 RepID=A0A4Q7LV34_9MICO|nr:hypothetical protein [Microcella putealis]RZS57589.1 hypothetical protein EV141_1303 [Microcella putealis]TQM24656.1 hypothetical protein BJ957_0912 [Microcella putealis]